LPGVQWQQHGLAALVIEQAEQSPGGRDRLGDRRIVRRQVEQAPNRGAVGRDPGERLSDQPGPRLDEKLLSAWITARDLGVSVGILALQPGDPRVVERKT
jgi:hypothetical protein